jgi:SAM-dependent methyltransferase
MRRLDLQIDYWNEVGPNKSFKHPVNLERLRQWVMPKSRILDLGCGYGRALGLLHASGYRNVIGVDPAPAMITAARRRFPAIAFELQTDPPRLDLPDAAVDATLLFTVLTCVPTDEGQRAIVAEITRVLRPGGLLYISDMCDGFVEQNYLVGRRS